MIFHDQADRDQFADDLEQFQPIAIVSGGFDPVHTGHIDLLHHAARLGRVVVLLNSDDWLTRKKGKPFMDWEERKDILLAIRHVTAVSRVDDSDDTVCAGLRHVVSHYKARAGAGKLPRIMFCNGGDRGIRNTPEQQVCDELGIETVFEVGGHKIQSSSELLKGWA